MWTMLSLLLVLTATSQVFCQETDGITLSVRGVTFNPHNVVTMEDIGVGLDGLTANTTHRPCCQSEGDWFLPGATSPLPEDITLNFYQSRTANGEVILNRRGLTNQGVFTCSIPNASGTLVNVYIGVYPPNEGAPSVTSLTHDSGTLTCVSSGGPATNVVWRRQCAPLSGPAYTTSQVVTDTAMAIYSSTLTTTVTDGQYSCTVENQRGRSSSTITVGAQPPFSVIITADGTPTAGQPLTLTCTRTNSGGTASFQWLDREGVVIGNTHTLTFGMLRESHRELYCVVTIGTQVGCTGIFMDVQVPSYTVSMTDVSGAVNTPISLSCTLDNPPPNATVEYKFYKGETPLSAGRSPNPVYTISSARLSDAGDDYHCQAWITIDYLDLSSPLVVNSTGSATLSLTIPSPNVALMSLDGVAYSGGRARLQCVVNNGAGIPGVTALMTVSRVEGSGSVEVVGSPRVTVGAVETLLAGSVFTRTYTYSVLSQQLDNGEYVCEGTALPADPALREFVTAGMATGRLTFSVVNPTLTVGVPMVTERILDISPYNRFTVSCTALSFVSGQNTNITKSFQWSVSVNGGSSTPLSNGVMTSGLDQSSSSSSVSVTVSSAGAFVYTCECDLALGAVPDQVTGRASTSVTVFGPSPPDPPTSLTVLEASHESVTVEWRVPAVAYDVERYLVMYGREPSDLAYNSSLVVAPSRQPDQVFSVELSAGLEPRTTYYYRVTAINTQGSTESLLAAFNTTGLRPSAPLSLQYTQTTPTDHTFNWLPPNDMDIPVDMYKLTCEGSLRDGTSIPTLTQATPMTRVSLVLTPWANYTCSVVASNSGGTSPRSNQLHFITPETPPTGMPRQLSVGPNPSRGRIRFSWAQLAPLDRNGYITGYSLTCTSGSEVVTMDFPAMVSGNLYTAAGFSAVTEYSCAVRAVNSAGAGPPATTTAMSGEDVPGAPPTNFNDQFVSPTMVSFTWAPPPSDQHNGVLTGYQLRCEAPPPSNTPLTEIFLANKRSGTLSGFSLTREYTCQLAAVTSPGAGLPATLTIVTVPSVPSGVGVVPLSSQEVQVTWARSPADAISHYTVYVNGTERGRPQGSEFVVMGLSPYSLYTVEVSGSNEGGEGERSVGMAVTTLEDYPGPVMCAPRWFSSTSSSVTVQWDPPTQENGVTLAYHLRLVPYTDRTSSLAETNVTREARVATLTLSEDLMGGVPYTVELVAENSVGRGTLPCNSTDFVIEDVPAAPTGVRVTRSTVGDTLTVTWDVPTLAEARGFVNYELTFVPSTSGQSKRQMTFGVCTTSPCIAPVAEGGVVIVDLDPATTYDLTITPSNSQQVAGMAVTVMSQAVVTPVSLALIVGAAVGGVAALLLVSIIVLIIIICCVRLRNRKGDYSTEPDFVLEDYNGPDRTNIYSAKSSHASPPSSSGTTSPRRQLTPPHHMSEKDFLEPVPVTEFSDFVAHMHLDRNKGFERAFNTLPKDGLESCNAAKKNEKKNRFRNVYPYDVSRVKLEVVGGDPLSDYINASYIDGYSKPRMYIAAQAPMPETIGDFWRMIWEHKLSQVVMLTNGKEGKTKCDKYWPGELHQERATPFLNIVCNEVTPYADYEIRKLIVTNMEDQYAKPLVVTHYLFTGWPDHGVPEYATALIGFIRRVKAGTKPDAPPILVHCLAGVGRTGAFIVLDIMLERLREQSTVNVYETLRDIRLKRANMVQSSEQFVFIHEALSDLVLCGDTEIPAQGFRHRVNALHKVRSEGEHESEFNYQFNLLDRVSPNQPQLQEALQHYNQHKNRYQDKIPNANSYVLLDYTGTPGGEYINASFVNGYKQRRAYIATQAPLATTVEDFWHMVWKVESRAIIMLCDLIEEKREVCHQYWPGEVEQPIQCGHLWVKLVSEDQLDEGLVKRKFFLSMDKTFSPENKKLSVNQFHYTLWPEHDRPPTTEQVRRILDEVDRVQRSTSNMPITVMCNDGMGRTGAFLSIHSQWDRVKTEGVADLFQFIKSARFHRSHLIMELEHYIFCHDTLADYVDTFEASDYANFK